MILPRVTVVHEGDGVVLNCTVTISGPQAVFAGPSVGSPPLPLDGFVWNFTALPQNTGRYSCRVQIETTLRQSTNLVVLPGERV